MYDISNRKSFSNLDSYVGEVREYLSPTAPVVLIANKSDLSESRSITIEEGRVIRYHRQVVSTSNRS